MKITIQKYSSAGYRDIYHEVETPPILDALIEALTRWLKTH